MAHVSSSQVITDLDASPVVKTETREIGGKIRTAIGMISSVSAATVNQTYAFTRIPARARVLQVRATHAATGTAGAYNVGVHRTAQHDASQTVVDADAFSAAVDANVARNSAVVGGGAALLAARKEMPLWQALNTVATGAGLTEALSDKEYDMTIAVTTVFNTGNLAMAFEVDYVMD